MRVAMVDRFLEMVELEALVASAETVALEVMQPQAKMVWMQLSNPQLDLAATEEPGAMVRTAEMEEMAVRGDLPRDRDPTVPMELAAMGATAALLERPATVALAEMERRQ